MDKQTTLFKEKSRTIFITIITPNDERLVAKGINYSIYQVFWGGLDTRSAALLSSFLCSVISAGGTFVWQIGTIAFYTAVIVGLLYNREVLKGDLA